MSTQEGKGEHKGPNGYKTTGDDAPEVEPKGKINRY